MTPLRESEHQNRPHLRNACVLGLVALVALVAGHQFSRIHTPADGERVVAYCCAGVVLVFGVAATRATARELSRVAGVHALGATSTPLRMLVQLVGYLLTGLGVLDVLRVDLSQFLVGGALTGIVLGIAAQQSLGNFFAGLVLMFARPYVPGEYIRVFSGAINGPHEGSVADVGLLYTTVQTAGGLLHIPNSVLLASAVGPTEPSAAGRD